MEEFAVNALQPVPQLVENANLACGSFLRAEMPTEDEFEELFVTCADERKEVLKRLAES